MKCYLVRHGETALNAQKVHQDHSGRLSEQGISQAERIAQRFAHISVDSILASPYERARHTAEIIAAVIHKPIDYTPLLVEIKRPTVVEGKLYSEPEALEVKRQIYEKFHDPAFRHSDEETFVDLRDRAAVLLHHLESRSDDSVLLVTHGEFMKVLVAVMLFGHDIDSRIVLTFHHSLKMTNTGLTVCDYSDNHWRLLTWNDQAHLGD